MNPKPNCSGFALMLVLWTLVVLSAVALTLAASVGSEVKASQQTWNDLQAERLAASGHEIASYLDSRFIGTASEDLAGLPVQAVIAGLRYRVTFDVGSVDLVFEGENGKFDLAGASEDDAATFFTHWTGNPDKGRQIAASIADWIDSDNESRAFGAEFPAYAGRDYLPRNAGWGAADLALVRGLTTGDLGPSVATNNTSAVREPLSWFIATTPVGDRVNPNYASRIVLESTPGMNAFLLQSILQMRQQSIFSSLQDFINRTGTGIDAPILGHVTFDRGLSPATLAVARLNNSARIRVERRIRAQILDPRRQRPPIRFLALVERNIPADIN